MREDKRLLLLHHRASSIEKYTRYWQAHKQVAKRCLMMCKDALLLEYTWFVRNYVRHLTLLKEKRKKEGRPEDK